MDFAELTKTYALFCFDFDGLLVDTEPVHFAAYKETIESYGGSFPLSFNEYAYLAHHHDRLKLARFAYENAPSLPTPWEEVRKIKMRIYSGLLETFPLKILPGVETFIAELARKGHKTCVVTNSLSGDIETIRKNLPALDQIEHWFTREQYKNPKPSPDGYLKALEFFNCPADKAVGFEDTQRGIKSLEAAKINPIIICPEDHPQLVDIPHVPFFRSFEDLMAPAK